MSHMAKVARVGALGHRAAEHGNCVAQFTVIDGVTFGDFVVARRFNGQTTSTQDVRIAKPYHLRVSPFANRTYNGVFYTYTSGAERTARGADNVTRTERVSPLYTAGDTIYATYNPRGRLVISGAPCEWLDDNRDGRRWESIEQAPTQGSGTTQFKIVSATDYGDVVICRTWNGTTQGTDDVYVAKPYHLRRTPFHLRSRAGIAYDYQNHIRRKATLADGTAYWETILPSYLAGEVLYATRNIIGGIDAVGTIQATGNLSIRFSDTRGGFDVSAGHGITVGMAVSVTWATGVRTTMTCTFASSGSVILDGGAGDILPPQDTSVSLTSGVVQYIDDNRDARRFERELVPIVGRFRITNGTDFQDVLECEFLDQLHTTQPIPKVYVAKSYLLRYSPFHNRTRSGITYIYTSPTRRLASQGGISETQLVTQRYAVGDTLMAMRGFVDGTELTFNGQPVLWLELNDGRAWAREFEP